MEIEAGGPVGSIEVVGVPIWQGSPLRCPPGAPPLDVEALERRRFRGGVGDVAVFTAAGTPAGHEWPGGATMAVALGAGPEGEISSETLRLVAAALVRAASGFARVGLWLPELPLPAEEVGQAVAEGLRLAAYRFDRYRSTPQAVAIERVDLLGPGAADTDSGLARGQLVADAVSLARDLVNTPAGDLTPRSFAGVAEEVAARESLALEVFDEERCRAEGLGGLLAVARGSAEPPRLVRLSYEPATAGPGTPLVALVGKGITFDSGGLSLKSGTGMETMKTDMSGAAAVLGALAACRRLEVPVRVLGLMCMTENMPGGRAQKPGDVFRARNGKTVEVLNTDAEGRLVLADGLSLAVEAGPAAIVDLATLTGACVVALGRRVAGLMGNSEELIAEVRNAAKRAGEPCWPLPLPAVYRPDIDSEIADMKNIGVAGQAGALVAGLFLAEFVGQVPWAHLDIAGPARSGEDQGYFQKGATGFGVRTLLELLAGFSPPPEPAERPVGV